MKRRTRVLPEPSYKRAPNDACFKHGNRQAQKRETRLQRVVIKHWCDGGCPKSANHRFQGSPASFSHG